MELTNHCGRLPHPEALAEIAGQARQLVWLTPEQRWHWTLGGSDTALYEEVCDRVEVVRTIEQLEPWPRLGRAAVV